MAWRAVGRTELASRAERDDGSKYVLEDQVGHLLRRAHQRHSAIFQATIGDEQLTQLQFAALLKLAELGEASQNYLGRLTAMDAATMQGVIKRLIARGLIERRPDPDDRRRLLLTLTADGTGVVGKVRARGHEISNQTLDPLLPAERETFLKLLRRLAD